MTSHLISMT